MEDELARERFRDVLEKFEALSHNLDEVLAHNAATVNDPQIAERVGRAKAFALRGADIVRTHIDGCSDGRSVS